MAKKKQAEDVLIIQVPAEEPPPQEEGIPPWMATFADMVTLLLCFFVLLLSFTNQDIANFDRLKGAIKQALGVQTEDQSARETPWADDTKEFESTRETEEDIKQLATTLQQFLDEEKLRKDASVAVDESGGVKLRVADGAMFRPGSAELDPRAITVLVEVVQVMMNTDFKLTVQGHTVGQDLGPDLLDRNWELSSVRAATCLRFILEHSPVSPDRMRAVGYGSSVPWLPNNTEENRALNRRVEFYFEPPGKTAW